LLVAIIEQRHDGIQLSPRVLGIEVRRRHGLRRSINLSILCDAEVSLDALLQKVGEG
jgi:hypothetical protein